MANTEKNPIGTEHVVLLSHDDIDKLRRKFSIPAGVWLRIPLKGDRPYRPKPGEVCLHSLGFDCGLGLSFHPFIRTVLAHFGVTPSQLSPNAWRHISGAVILWRICSQEQDHVTVDEFNFCYKFRYRHAIKFWDFCARDGRALVLDCPKFSHARSEERFVFASGTDWEFSSKEGAPSRAPPVPREWGFPDEEKQKEPTLSNFHMSHVYRALKFNSYKRSYKDLITSEHVQKYLLDDIPALSSPSMHSEEA